MATFNGYAVTAKLPEFPLSNNITAASTATIAAPAGTTSLTAVMQGIGGSITPTSYNNALIAVSGQMVNATVADGATVDIRYGTGTAPVNGAAVTGTLVGIAQTSGSITAGQKSGFSVVAVVNGLIPGTTYWVDASLMAVTGGTASISGITVTTVEL
jgi:hypothetical protein